MLKRLFQSKDFYKTLITLLLVFVPLYPKFPLINITGTYVAIRLEDILIIICVLSFLPLIFGNMKHLFANNIFRAMAIFVFVGFASVISSVYLTKSADLNISLLHLLRRVEYFSLFVLGLLYFKIYAKTNYLGYFIKILGFIVLFAFIYGLLQRYLSFPVVITQNSEYSKGIALQWIPGAHINSTFAGHYDLASYLVLVLPFFVSSFFLFKKRWDRMFSLAVLFGGYWLLNNAVSRISILSFVVSSSLSLFFLKKYKEIFIFGLISMIIFGFSAGLRERYMRIFNVIKEKLVFVNNVYANNGQNIVEDRSTSIRMVVEWPRAIRSLSKNPLLGTGYSSITLATDNDYLRSLGETGILGFSAFMLILFSLLKKVYTFKSDNITANIFIYSLFGGIIGVLINAFFIDIFESSKFATSFWLIVGLAVGMVEKTKYEHIR